MCKKQANLNEKAHFAHLFFLLNYDKSCQTKMTEYADR